MDRNKGGARERRKGGRKATRGAGAVGAPRAQGNRRQKAMPLGCRQGLRSPPPAVAIHPSALRANQTGSPLFPGPSGVAGVAPPAAVSSPIARSLARSHVSGLARLQLGGVFRLASTSTCVFLSVGWAGAYSSCNLGIDYW